MTQSGIATHPMVDQWLAFCDPGAIQLKVGKVEFGQGIAAALVWIAAEELDVAPARIRLTAGDTAISPNEGFTAGSMSIELSGAAVRDAASAARALLVAAAFDAPRKIVDGAFWNDHSPTGESYWTLAARVDLHVPIADHARPKPAAAYTLVGRAGGGVDLAAAVSGAAFIHDLEMPGMLHGRVVRSADPLAKSPLLPAIDLPPGVRLMREGAFVGIVAPSEVEAIRIAERHSGGARWTVPDGERPDPVRQVLLAASGLKEGGQFPPVEGGTVIEVIASRELVAHASIGPSCAIARWQGDFLTVWSHSQGVWALREALARLFAISSENIRVIHVNGAGCYGHNGADDAAADAAILARHAPGQPVRVAWTRKQELTNAPFGPAMRSRARACVVDGRIASFSLDIVSGSHGRRPGIGGINLLAGYLRADPVTDPISDPPLAVGGGADRNAVPGYRIEHVDVRKHIVEDTGVRTSSLRSLGAHVNVVTIESVMDEAAAIGGVDPAGFRLAHLDDHRPRAVIDKVVEMAAWPGKSPAGIGYARYKNKAAYCAVIAEIELLDTVRVTKVWCAVDAGLIIDPDGVANQIEGGIIQSISWTLRESVPVVGGVPSIEGWDDYPILRFDEIPQVEVALIDRPEEPSLGAGEAAQGPAAAAVVNAVATALGHRITALPITRERIIEALS